MHVHLGPRLERGLSMLRGSQIVADIGSDHGRLAAALLQQGAARRVIACDISALSLEKARALAGRCGLNGRMDFRVADGLGALEPGEADAIVVAGMGGLVMGRILREGEAVARAARRIVLQPQGNAAELRAYLYGNGYAVDAEAIVLDAGRYYQLIQAHSGPPRPLPPGWPPGYWGLGPAALESQAPLFAPLARKLRAGHQKRLDRARRDGMEPPLLLEAIHALDQILNLWEVKDEACGFFKPNGSPGAPGPGDGF